MTSSVALSTIEDLAKIAIGSAIKVHKSLGPGLLESAYKECLFYELTSEGLFVESEKAMPLIYEKVKMDIGYRLDLLVEGQLVIECKAKEKTTDVDLAQTLTYMKLGGFRLALMINFHTVLLKNGIKRIVNGL
jgi:GxxExxY protein